MPTILVNVKMPIIVGILTFISRIDFMLKWFELEKVLLPRGRVRNQKTGSPEKRLISLYKLILCIYSNSPKFSDAFFPI